MLKRVLINKRTVPVPVPVKTLADAFRWIESSMIPQGETLTSAMLDGNSVLELWDDKKTSNEIVLDAESQFEIRIESAMDLALQGLEAIHNLCGAILRDLKPLAVYLWQSKAMSDQQDLYQIAGDVQLVIELIDHAKDMRVESQIDFGPMLDFQSHLKKICLSLSAASAKTDWRACAQILLRDTSSSTGLESSLRSLQEEVESCHLRLLTSRGAAATGNM